MVETFKYKSRSITVIVGIIVTLSTYLAVMRPQELAAYLPGYEKYAILIIVIASVIVNQFSEEKRVSVAEQMAIEKQSKIMGTPLETEDVVMNDEYLSEEYETEVE